MNELLSNEEIDTLMEMFRSEESGLDESPGMAVLTEFVGGGGGRETVVSPVDLLKPNRLSREQMRDFERLFESAAMAVGTTMCDRLRYEMHCDCVAVEQLRFQNWLRLLGGHAAIYILHVRPLEQPVFFSVTTNLLYGCVDRILGGHGKVTDVPSEFSAAEFAVADAFVEPILDRLIAALEELTEMAVTIESRCTNPALAAILPSQDVVLSAHLQTGGEFLLGDLRIAIPYTAIEPWLTALGTTPGSLGHGPGSMREVLARTMHPVELEMSVELGEADIRLRDLLSLAVGDVISLNRSPGEPLVAPVQGKPKFTGHVGTVGSRLAFKIAAVVE